MRGNTIVMNKIMGYISDNVEKCGWLVTIFQ